MSFWKTLGKIGLIGGAGVATALTGGAASPLLAAAIGAGAGVGASKLSGSSWKDALISGGIGAATGGLGAAATGAGAAAKAAGAGVNAAKGAANMGWQDALVGAATGGNGWAGAVQNGLGVAGALAQGKQAQRTTDTGNILTRDSQGITAQAQNDNARAQAAQIEMQQKEAERVALNDAYKNALRSSLAMNMQDAKFARPTGVPDFSMSGGARPSALGAEGKQAAGVMNARAMEELLHPGTLTSLPMPQAYSLTDLPKANTMDNILGAAGTVGKVLEANQARTDAAKQSDLIAQLLASSQQRAQAPVAGIQMPAGGSGVGPTNWADALRF